MRRRHFLLGLGSAAAWPRAVAAQPRGPHTILWVSTEAQPDPFIEGFRNGMRDRGYVEGHDLSFVLRYAPGDPGKVRAMLSEFAAVPADLIVSSGPAILAMKEAVGRPVLFAISGDPVALGIAQSMARPGGNFTGVTFLSLEVAQKRVQIVRELLPELRTLAVLSQSNHPGEAAEHAATQEAASALGLELAYVPFPSFRELDDALARVARAGAGAMLVFPDGVTMVNRARIAAFAQAHRLPTMFGWREYCDAGGLASYGANQTSTYTRLSAYADRILRGEEPADLPVEQASAFELIVNMRTARALGVEVPATILARADEVIE
jgi:putative tryptophan/tyrosine transport system substrate-binding protein